jgi:hypothetical protein
MIDSICSAWCCWCSSLGGWVGGWADVCADDLMAGVTYLLGGRIEQGPNSIVVTTPQAFPLLPPPLSLSLSLYIYTAHNLSHAFLCCITSPITTHNQDLAPQSLFQRFCTGLSFLTRVAGGFGGGGAWGFGGEIA